MGDAASKCLAEYIKTLGEIQSSPYSFSDSPAAVKMWRQLAKLHLECLKEIMERNGADFAEYGVPVKGWDEL
jgi:hypothetical protein